MPPQPPALRAGSQVRVPSEPASAPRPGPDSVLEVQARGRAGSEALRALLADLGPQIRRGRGLAEEVVGGLAGCPTGIARLDAKLGGGFPRGRLSELCGAPCSGRTSLAMTLLAETLASGALAAWIDPADAFDPASAAAALAARRCADGSSQAPDDVDDEALRRLLWVRARTELEAIRSCERILQTEGFALTLLDLAHSADARPHRAPAPIRPASWLRLTRLAARQRSALVVLSNGSQTGSHAELVLEMRARGTRFAGPPMLLDALQTTAVLRRHRTRPSDEGIALCLKAELALKADLASESELEAEPGERESLDVPRS